MLKVKKEELLIFVSQYVYICAFYFFNNIGSDNIIFSLIHGTLSSILMCGILRSFNKQIDKNLFSLVSMYVFISIVYFHLSSIKYAIDYLYYGYIDNAYIRMLGSCICFFVMLAEIFLLNHLNKHMRYCSINNEYKFEISGIFTWVFAIAGSILMLSISLLGSFSSISESVSNQIFSVVLGITIVTCLMKIKVNKKGHYYGFGPLVFVFAIILVETLALGKRTFIVVPVVICLASALYLGLIKNHKIIYRLVIILPIILMAFSTVIFITSSRYNIYSNEFIRDLAYRFDLSDFAMTEAMRTKWSDYSFASITEPIQLAIPGIFSKVDKLSIQNVNQYKYILSKSNLYINADYNDTVFSMGSEIAGIVGMIAIPIIIFEFLVFVEKLISVNDIFKVTKLAVIPFFCSVESSWQKIVLDFRMYAVVFIAFYIVLTLFLRKKRWKRKLL